MVKHNGEFGSSKIASTANTKIRQHIEETWASISEQFDNLHASMPKFMERQELSFHEHVKLLGYLCMDTFNMPGDIVEIGVWKGKSLALMDKLAPRGTKVIGVDPCEISGQKDELTTFVSELIPNATVVVNYSERAIKDVLSLSTKFKILHIDGGHQEHHVWSDFILYSQFVVPGGYVIFDDYADDKHSPEVKIAVDQMYRKSLFDGFDVLGPIDGFLNSFVLRKKVPSA